MSYPRNAASPPRIAIGPVVQITDGAVQTSGVSVCVRVEGGAETAGGGTVSYGTLSGIVYYTPTQGETDYTAFVLVAYKTGCIPAQVTIATSASATAGYSGVDWSKLTSATSTVNLSGTTISTSQAVASVSGSVGSVTGAVGSVTGSVGSIAGVTFPTNFGTLLINASGHVSRVVLVDTTTTNTDMRGTDNAALASAWTSTRAGYLDSVLLAQNSNQRTVQVTGSNHVASDVHAFQADVIDAAALATSAVQEIQSGLATSGAQTTAQADLDDIQSRLPAALVSGRMDSYTGAMGNNVITSGTTDATFLAEINAEVLDVLQTDLFSELSAIPGASSSLKDKITFLFMLARNKMTSSSTTATLFRDDGTTTVGTSPQGESGGVFTRGEFA